MRATMSPVLRYTAIKRASRFCLWAGLVLGLIQFGLMPWLGLRGQVLTSAVVASLAMQGIALMLIVSLGRVRFVAVRRRARDLQCLRVRSVWRQPEPALAGE